VIVFRWLGVAGFELRVDDQVLLVDPFLTRPPAFKLLFGRTPSNGELLRQHLPQAHYILVSHPHYDHLLDVPEIARYSVAKVYGSAHTCQICIACGVEEVQVQRVQAGERLSLGGFEVEVLAGEHAPLMFYGSGKLAAKLKLPLRLSDFVLDETFSFRIQSGQTSLLAWHNCHPRPAPCADVLLIGPDVSPQHLPELLAQVQPRLLIPVHWDNFFRPLSQPLRSFFRPPSWRQPWLRRYDPQQVAQQAKRILPGMQIIIAEVLRDLEIG
jgi:L-ascorbate metabolism protein UlaG (beta-lactamase superfamily)